MTIPLNTKTPLLSTVLAGILALTFAQSALAGYTVMDDDLFPMQAIPASVAAAQARAATLAAAQRQVSPQSTATASAPSATENYTILFRKGNWGLNEDGNNAISELLPLMQGKKIIITGRADAAPNDYLAGKRANTLRAWLIRNGIFANQIETRTKDGVNTSIDNQFPVELQLVSAGADMPSAPQRSNTLITQQPAPAVPVLQAGVSNGIRTTITPMTPQVAAPTVAIVATPNPDARLDVIRQITAAAQAGRLDYKAAIATIAELLNTQTAKPLVQAPAPAPDPAAEFGLIAAQETARPKEWLLSSEKTLRDNVAEWAKKDGYELDWKASNYFKVGRTRPVTGELMEVVDRVATAAGLKMEVWKKDRLIRISDRPQ